MKVMVTGGRHYQDPDGLLWQKLDRLHFEKGGITKLSEGGCPTGADARARQWARQAHLTLDTWHADWETFGRAAGPIRNSAMVVGAGAEICIVAPGGDGTYDCARKAERAGIAIDDELWPEWRAWRGR